VRVSTFGDRKVGFTELFRIINAGHVCFFFYDPSLHHLFLTSAPSAKPSVTTLIACNIPFVSHIASEPLENPLEMSVQGRRPLRRPPRQPPPAAARPQGVGGSSHNPHNVSPTATCSVNSIDTSRNLLDTETAASAILLVMLPRQATSKTLNPSTASA
jgi:hypothetical protein